MEGGRGVWKSYGGGEEAGLSPSSGRPGLDRSTLLLSPPVTRVLTPQRNLQRETGTSLPQAERSHLVEPLGGQGRPERPEEARPRGGPSVLVYSEREPGDLAPRLGCAVPAGGQQAQRRPPVRALPLPLLPGLLDLVT